MMHGPYFIPDNARLVLVRGLPGSGKSTFAKSLDGFIHFEADMWQIDSDGNYQFGITPIKIAHQNCQNATRLCLEAGYNVVVSNTFTRRWEMTPYYDMGYPAQEIVMTGDYGNIHGVPESVIQDMRDRWED